MSLAGKTILVTGSTDGLGKLVAASLAGDGARVLLHGRDQAKGEAVLARMKASSRNPDLEFHRADLTSLAQVRGLAKAVLGGHDHLDALINNAGIALFADDTRRLSADGHELHFQVNYLAPFLLTELLAPTLRASAPARIVNVSSLGQAAIDFDDVMIERDYSPMRGYCQSKLAQVMNTIDLGEALKSAGVTAAALHPGTYMNTNMVIGAGIKPLTPVEEGVEATRRLAVSPDVEGQSGLFYNQQIPQRANAQAHDAHARRRLRDLSLRLCGLGAD